MKHAGGEDRRRRGTVPNSRGRKREGQLVSGGARDPTSRAEGRQNVSIVQSCACRHENAVRIDYLHPTRGSNVMGGIPDNSFALRDLVSRKHTCFNQPINGIPPSWVLGVRNRV